LAGRQPTETPTRPASAWWEAKEKTEYARPRFSRTSWNRREDVPPPRAVFSTPSAYLRSSPRGMPLTPSTRFTCSKGRLAVAEPETPRRARPDREIGRAHV